MLSLGFMKEECEKLKCEELKKVIEAGHTLYRFIEERDLAFEILDKFVNKKSKEEELSEDLENLKRNVDDWIDYNKEQKRIIKDYIDHIIKNIEKDDLLGHLILIFLLAWNMNRFKDCSNFSLENLKKFGSSLHKSFKDYLDDELRHKSIKDKVKVKIKDKDKDILWEKVKDKLECFNKKLKHKTGNNCFQPDENGNQNEWVGTFKVGHIFFPKVIVPIDNPIAEALCFKYPGQPFELEFYKKFWENIRKLVSKCPDLESKLKEIDELFYVLFSLNIKLRLTFQEKFLQKGEKNNLIQEIFKKQRFKQAYKFLKKLSNIIQSLYPNIVTEVNTYKKLKVYLKLGKQEISKETHLSYWENSSRAFITLDVGVSPSDKRNEKKLESLIKDTKLESFKKKGTGIILIDKPIKNLELSHKDAIFILAAITEPLEKLKSEE